MLAVIVGIVVAGVITWQVLHLAVVLSWCDRQTRGGRYYGRSLERRRRFKWFVRVHSLLLSPILAVLGAATRRQFRLQSVRYAGIAGPAGACSSESFRRAAEYRPRSEDVFVVTQMRSGTTWMQHLVYQVLTRGSGDLTGEGLALNAISPWLESLRTVGVDEAPLVGRHRQGRIIKTHLPVALCPFDPRAKYIYVVRHPLACFASCVDFVRNNLQGFAPDWQEFARWYRSDDHMWWGSWVTHVGGWQCRAASQPNVLLVRYEDMVADLQQVVGRVAAFLDLPPLAETDLASAVGKCRLEYMRTHCEAFEMYPPHLLQSLDPFFSGGRKDRWKSVPAAVARQILQWCRSQCSDRGVPIGLLYSDLAADEHDTESRCRTNDALASEHYATS